MCSFGFKIVDRFISENGAHRRVRFGTAKAGRGGFERIHQCFDLGHAKVWSDQPLAEWLDFLEQQQERGFRLHFHLHANRGLFDDHLSFVEAERLEILGPDGYLGTRDYFGALDEIRRRFPSSRKIFEVPPHRALTNMERVERELAR